MSLKECRAFKDFYALLKSIQNDPAAPRGHRIFYELMHYLLYYGLCCINDNKFPALTKCWNKLTPLFLTKKFDCDWFVFCWMFCDFPLDLRTKKVLLDDFTDFFLSSGNLSDHFREHLPHFHSIMKASRLGLYQEILSSSKTTKFKELFTNTVISTVRGVPYYESGEIFVTRVVSYLGDNFSIHDSKAYPKEYKNHLEMMVKNKLFMISETGNDTEDYLRFMKLAGPYWMSCTHPDQESPILSPDEYKFYHYMP